MQSVSGFAKLDFAYLKPQILDDVYVFGCPQRYDSSVSKGIISHTERKIERYDSAKIPLYQTDAPINRGNSGGPVINSRGKIIG